MENIVRAICQMEGLPCRSIQVLSGGQVNRVFLIDTTYVVRIGSREDAFERLKHETELIQSLEGKIPVPRIYAFGQQDGLVYQIQQFIPGQKLYSIWRNLQPDVQENMVAELATHLKVVHSINYPHFGYASQDTKRYDVWSDFLSDKFKHTLEEIKALNLRMVPGFLEMAVDYFDKHKHVLQDGVPTLVHGDLSLVNILADNGRVSAILDFEYSMQAPLDYELWVMEAFCLYPNDWAEEDKEDFCTADFASFIPLLRKHYPALFEVRYLRERMNLYHLDAALSSHLAWRKDNLSTIPSDRMAAKEFYMARITNFIFRHGTRMF
jgi:aminoglycoside phosphotransferase (APT) family kinase protein